MTTIREVLLAAKESGTRLDVVIQNAEDALTDTVVLHVGDDFVTLHETDGPTHVPLFALLAIQERRPSELPAADPNQAALPGVA